MAAKTGRGCKRWEPLLPALEAGQLKCLQGNSFAQTRGSIGRCVKRTSLDNAQLDPLRAQFRRERAVKSGNAAAMDVEFGR
jgi:hypothetical protein